MSSAGSARRIPPWLLVAAAMFAVGWGANQFVSLLVAYHEQRGISIAVGQGLFGIYAAGLALALLLGGPAADGWGRAHLVRPAAVLSVVATAVLMLGSHSVGLLFAGRFLGGLASGAMFAAGTAWVKELSTAPYDTVTDDHVGARRAAIALSLGFGVGPLITGVLAQWGPDPLVVSYIPHLVIMVSTLPGLWLVPETGTPPVHRERGIWAQVRVRSAAHARFLGVVAPAAPWVFGGPAVAFAVLPAIASPHTHGHGIVFAGLVTGVTLAVGVGVQSVARRLDQAGLSTGVSVSLVAIVVGMLVGAAAAHLGNPPLVLVAACFLGVGYGLGMVCGLIEVHQLAGPDDLAGLTAVFLALTYIGFALPVILANLTGVAGYPTLLICLACLAAGSLCLLRFSSPRLPVAR